MQLKLKFKESKMLRALFSLKSAQFNQLFEKNFFLRILQGDRWTKNSK